ncbi:hypothetical protein [Promicromonospora sp. NPDC050262]
MHAPGGNTQYRRIEGRGHSLVFDNGWQSVAQTALNRVASHADAGER